MSNARPSRNVTLAIILGFLVAGFAAAQDRSPGKSVVLENGLKVFLVEKHNWPLLSLEAAVNLGIKDETAETSGLAHLLEHCLLFRGSDDPESRGLELDLRRHGAYLNGNTSQDLVVFEMCLSSTETDFGLVRMKDVLFGRRISQGGLDEEKEIILEEISQLEDDPIRFATILLFQNVFKKHPYGNSVFGSKETIKTLTLEIVQQCYEKYFVPGNCALALVGDFAIKDMEEKVRAAFGGIKGESPAPVQFPKLPPVDKKVELRQELDVKEGYLLVGAAGPDYNDPDQFGADVLTEIVGRGINPMLNPVLRGRFDLVQTIQMNYAAFEYGGVMWLVFTLDPKNINRATSETINFLKRAREQNYSRDEYPDEDQRYVFDYLESAKNQIKFNVQQAQERGLNLAAALARHMLLKRGGFEVGYLKNIEKLSSSDLRAIAGKYLGRGEYVVVSVTPQKKS